MTDVWQQMFDGIYLSPIAVDAAFTSAGGALVTLRACDETKGTPISGGPGQAESVRPTCRIRAAELAAAGITMADLPDSNIVINGTTWRVKASRIMPSPMGEAAGEIMLILLNDG